MKFLLVMLTAALGCGAQSIGIRPGGGSGRSASFLLGLNSPQGKEPLALQWDLTIPAGITVNREDILAGSAAESAQKTLACAALPQQHAVFRCLVAGGQKPLPNGTIAVVKFQRQSTHEAPAPVRISNAKGVGADLKEIKIPDAEASVVPR